MFHTPTPHRCAGLAVATCAAVLFATPVHAAVVLHDTFDLPGGPATRGDDAADPLDVAWYGFQSPISIETVGDNHMMSISPSHSFSRHSSGTFGAVELGLGDSVRLSFDAQVLEPTTPATLVLKIGLYDSLGTAPTDDLFGSRQAAADDAGVLLELANGFNARLSNDLSPTLGGEGSQVVNVKTFRDSLHHFDLIITALNATQNRVEYFQDGELQGSVLLGALRRFDNVQFGTGVNVHGVQLDNLVVEYTPVPEPTTAALGALMATGLLATRRRR